MMLYLVLVLILLNDASGSQFDLQAVGSRFPALVYTDWFNSFRLAGIVDTKLSYVRASSGRAQTEITLPDTAFDFTASDFPLTKEQKDVNKELDLQHFPLVIGSYSMVQNLPGSPNSSSIVYSRAALVGIFNGTITQWNHPILVACQDNAEWRQYLLRTNHQIKPFIRPAGAGGTYIITSALSKFSTEWKRAYGVFNTWPSIFVNGSKLPFMQKNFDPLPDIATTPYSMTYINTCLVKINGWTQVGRVENAEGKYRAPDLESLKSVREAITEAPDDLILNLADLPGVNSYPFVGTSYVLIQGNTETNMTLNCTRRRQLFKYFHFVLSSEDMEQDANQDMFTKMPDVLNQAVLEFLSGFQCDGKSLLAVEAPLSHSSSFVIPVAAILGALSILSILTLLWVATKIEIGRVLKGYCIIVCIAGLIGYAGVAMWLIVPTNDSICMARVWLPTLALTMMLSGSIARASQLYFVAMSKESIEKLEKVIHQTPKLAIIPVCIVVAIQIIIDIIWQFADPYHSSLDTLDMVQLTGEYHCYSNTLALWVIEVVWILFFSVYIVIQTYRSWEFSGNAQTKWTFFGIYNVMLSGSACIPLIFLITGEKALASIAVAGLIFVFFELQLALLVPPLFYYSPLSSAERTSGGSSHSNQSSTSVTSTYSKPTFAQ